jgi:phosphoribosylanthranilate isomerase
LEFNVGHTRIKICGITSYEDALTAISAGADALGFVFWEGSARAVNVDQARKICERLPPFVSTVGLLVNAEPKYVDELLRTVPIHLLQFHGDETSGQCQQFGKPFLKAIRMRPDLDIEKEIVAYSAANGVLLDAYRKGIPGGTGESFDWGRIPVEYRSQIILAGGLTELNVGQAINCVRPYAVDVSGGVEMSPGEKDSNKVERFVRAVKEADNH